MKLFCLFLFLVGIGVKKRSNNINNESSIPAKRSIDEDEEGYEPIPDLVTYFKVLPAHKKWASLVTEINQDGGNEIYRTISPFWDGEDDAFTIESFSDVDQFPHLNKMTLFSTDEAIVKALEDKGIASIVSYF
ncbi:DUF6892 domain-containing protein [Myroides sp. C8-3]|uniref:DUF6892 domain-containing protein n=1 Tax=Myroides sp. C8-3 TaxID=3400533 RepID=UPI003D2F7CFC